MSSVIVGSSLTSSTSSGLRKLPVSFGGCWANVAPVRLSNATSNAYRHAVLIPTCFESIAGFNSLFSLNLSRIGDGPNLSTFELRSVLDVSQSVRSVVFAKSPAWERPRLYDRFLCHSSRRAMLGCSEH